MQLPVRRAPQFRQAPAQTALVDVAQLFLLSLKPLGEPQIIDQPRIAFTATG
jgi:hypothetical protein